VAHAEVSGRFRRAWALHVLLVFLASRIISTAILAWFAVHQGPSQWTGERTDFLTFSNLWDGRWYEIVAYYGYPAALPVGESGHVTENAWAFMPAYPLLVRGLVELSGLPFDLVAVVLAVACAFGSALVLHRLMSTWLPSGWALAVVALYCCNPVSPILQVAYAESMHALLLTTALLLLVRRRYLAMLPVVALMAITRPSGLAFALAMAGHVAYRWWASRPARGDRREGFPAVEFWAASLVGLVSALVALAWPLAAAIATGSLTAYTDTELAWRSGYIGHQELVPFTPWFQGAAWWAEFNGLPAWLGVVVLVVALALVVAAMRSPWMRRLGPDVRIWVGAWLVYLLAVFFPQSSTWRLLFPAFPVLGALAVPRSRLLIAATLVVFVVAQWFWVAGMWAVSEHDWTPP